MTLDGKTQPAVIPPEYTGRNVLELDWASYYAESNTWGPQWRAVTTDGEQWPTGIQVYGEKMYV